MEKFVTKKVPFRVIDGVFKYLVEIRCDTISDVTPPDKSWYIGSIAAAVDEGAIYMLNSSGKWIKQNA